MIIGNDADKTLPRLDNAATATVASPRPAATPSMLPAPGQVFRDCADCPEMVVIPPGEFMMGTDPSETARELLNDSRWEQPRHAVRVSQRLALGKYPVTRDEYARFVQASGYSGSADCPWGNPGFAQTGRDPAVCVSWEDAKAYVAWLSRTTGKGYRLPTEAEWEYAARAGTRTARYWGEAIGTGNANCDGCGSQWDNERTSPVGSFQPNAFGLYDMLGNAWQWTEDCWTDSYQDAPTDSSLRLVDDCSRRVARGGSWDSNTGSVRAGDRSGGDPSFRDDNAGFRVARTQ